MNAEYFLFLDNSAIPFDCSTFKSVMDVGPAANNTARLAGARKFKIEACSSANYTGTTE